MSGFDGPTTPGGCEDAIVHLGGKRGITAPIGRTLAGAAGGPGKRPARAPVPGAPMSVLYLVRHGESEWNRIGRIQGRRESPLTGAGRAQAVALGRMLRAVLPDPGIDVVASPLERAFETATIIAGELGRATGRAAGGRAAAGDVRSDRRIIDFDVGILAGYPGWDAVAADYPELARLRREDPVRFRPPGGESGADVLARARSFLDEREAAGRDTLVVCHGVINKFLRAAALGITGAGIIALGEDQDTVYRLEGGVETEWKADREGAAR